MQDLGRKKKVSLRASSLEMYRRETSVTADDKKIYLRDTDNLYPMRIENVVNNSPTGRRASNMMAKFIMGKGVATDADIPMMNSRGETLNTLAKRAAQSIAKQYGVFFHVGYTFSTEDGLGIKKNSIKVMDYVPMAKSKEDDSGYPGKFYYLDLDEKNIFSNVADKTFWYYPYNPDRRVILEQMRNDCALKEIENPTPQQLVQNYRGQIFYLNLTPEYQYAFPLWDSVYDDLDSEYRISRYTNGQTRNGWLGKTVVKKFADDEEEDERADNSFDSMVKSNLGADGAADVLVIDVPTDAADDVDKAFKVDQLKAQYDDKLFATTIQNLRQNIMGAFNNVPEILVYAGTGALFGPNSETYIEAKKFYWEQNEWERQELEACLAELTGREVSFLPIVDETISNGI